MGGHDETRAGWDIVARAKYRAEIEEHVEVLRAGGHNLLGPEIKTLGPLLPTADIVHLQCSHGFDTLGLLNAGAASVTGVDISPEMIAQAREKARAAGLAAEFHVGDAVDPPAGLARSADIVYSGRGALPWILDLERWAGSVRRLLRPGGHVYVFEGHPLDALWDREADHVHLREGASYFDPEPREHPGFPASVVERVAGAGRPRLRERHWRPGEVIGVLVREGFTLQHFSEHPVSFWGQFPNWPESVRRSLPHTYSILARRESPPGR